MANGFIGTDKALWQEAFALAKETKSSPTKVYKELKELEERKKKYDRNNE